MSIQIPKGNTEERDVLGLLRELSPEQTPAPSVITPLPDPHTLRDHLETKGHIFSLLEKVGYIGKEDYQRVKTNIATALEDLNQIIKQEEDIE